MEVATLQRKQSEIFRELQTSDSLELYHDMVDGKAFKEMEQESVNESVKEILQYVSFITGAGVTKELTRPFLRELREIVMKHYPFLTLAEIKSAFRLNSIGMFDDTVQLYGKNVTLSFIGQVLAKYKIYRHNNMKDIVDASHRVNEKLLMELPPTEVAPVTEQDRRDMLETAYQAYKKYPTLQSIVGLDYIYQYMINFGLLKEDDVKEQIGIARAKTKARTFMEMSAISQNMIGQKMELQEKYDAADNWKESAYFQDAMGRTVINKFEKLHKEGAESVFD